MLVATTAVHALVAIRAGASDTVLVHGGWGGVGLLAAQLAVARRNHRRHGERTPARGPARARRGPRGLKRRAARPGPRCGTGRVDANVDAAGPAESLGASLVLVADRGSRNHVPQGWEPLREFCSLSSS